MIDLDDKVLVESNNVDVTEHVIGFEEDIVAGDGVIVPVMGIKFNN